ncbi:hypothetical protein SAMN05421788_11038 [Filimonas lacunae]|uniref:DUF4157 domain-containing protein n=1 Tax=Filimonas lacunae TaxID=477680 RepID=A0A1N7R7G8_9BACT|nr:DUF4157 domain-containing protein [Filimonas lacunae]SIT30979.1 hypothetical protein SAMN05421788_11038 [Filimonas lacunae]
MARYAARKMKASAIAMVVRRTIYLHGVTAEEFLRDSEWVRHEVCHVRQYQRMTVLLFLPVYLWYCLRYGYYNNPLEIEARAEEKNPAIMNDTMLVPVKNKK